MFISTGKCTFLPPIEETSFFDRWRPLKKTKTNENAELSNLVPMDAHTNQLLHLRLREHCRREGRKIVRARGTGVFCETVSPSKTHEVSQARLHRDELNKDNSNKHAEVDRRRIPSSQSYMKSYRQLSNSTSLQQGKAHKLII